MFRGGSCALCGCQSEGKQQHSPAVQIEFHSLWNESLPRADLSPSPFYRKVQVPSAIEANPEIPAASASVPCSKDTRSITMPSIEETCVLSAAAPATAATKTSAALVPCRAAAAKQDFFARDMEELVSEIKENLRLSSGGLKSRPAFSVMHKSSRPSPYRIPSRSRSWGDPNCDACAKAGALCCGHSCKKSTKVTAESDDPYEMLQELLRDGGLIKEAVRRLGMGLSPKQRYFYDSDEETRSPIRMCHVEL